MYNNTLQKGDNILVYVMHRGKCPLCGQGDFGQANVMWGYDYKMPDGTILSRMILHCECCDSWFFVEPLCGNLIQIDEDDRGEPGPTAEEMLKGSNLKKR